MYLTLIAIILGILSFQVLPVALDFDIKRGIGRTLWFGLILLLGQLLLFVAGYYLGRRFMHQLDDFIGAVIFAGFFLVGIRFIMDAFKVRKGERTFNTESSFTVFLASMAQGINTFLAGILISSIVDKSDYLMLVIGVATILVIAFGIAMKPQKQTFVFASLLYFIGGFVLIFGSVYLGFFV